MPYIHWVYPVEYYICALAECSVVFRTKQGEDHFTRLKPNSENVASKKSDRSRRWMCCIKDLRGSPSSPKHRGGHVVNAGNHSSGDEHSQEKQSTHTYPNDWRTEQTMVDMLYLLYNRLPRLGAYCTRSYFNRCDPVLNFLDTTS